MTVSIDLWQLVVGLLSAVTALIGGFWVIGERMFSRFEGHVQEQLGTMKESIDQENAARVQLEKDVLLLKADLPLAYVRREDYIRNQTVIESKLDSIASKLEVLQIQGAKRG